MIVGLCVVRLTILVLIIESHWADSTGAFAENVQDDNYTCWNNKDYTVITECHPCSAFEVASKSIDVCHESRYKEVIQCKSGVKITRRYVSIP